MRSLMSLVTVLIKVGIGRLNSVLRAVVLILREVQLVEKKSA